MMLLVRQRLQQWVSGGFRPQTVHTWEWLVMRMGLALLTCYILSEPHPFLLSSEDHPVGLAKLLPLNFLYDPAAREIHSVARFMQLLEQPLRPQSVVCVLTLLCSLWYVWGKGLRWSALGLGLLLVVVRTHFNSQGYTHHGTQLVALCLLAQTLTAWWYHKRQHRGLALPLAAYMVYYTQGMIAISYVASALTKMINSKGLWLWRSKYICVELIKTHRLDYYRELDPALAADPALATWLLHHPLAGQVMFGAGFVVEALAIVALHSRRWALFTGLAIIALHESVELIMKLHFVNHELLTLLFLVNPCFWLWWCTQRARGLPTATGVRL